MTNEQRIAMARIISDMIKADNIIEESEIRDMKSLMEKYSLTQGHMSDARLVKFSEAVTILQELSFDERKKFFDNIYKIALSDSICVSKEALLLIALQYCLLNDDSEKGLNGKRNKPYLISCPTGETSVNDQYMVYLESEYDEERNKEIIEHFRLLVTQSRLNGFNFIYIPKMVEEFKGMDRQYVLDVIKYMSPDLSDGIIADVYNRLCKMTTEEFFHSVLYERLNVKAIYDAPPSILINIGTSVVPYCAADGSVQYYTEFLCIPILQNAMSLVDEVLDFYHKKVSIKTVTLTDNQGQFKYFGFYKALFDFLVTPPPVAPDLIFLGQNVKSKRYEIMFRYKDGYEKTITLTPKRYTLYYNIVRDTYTSSTKGLPASKVDRTSVSHLKKDLSEVLTDITYTEQYLPKRRGNVWCLRLDKSKVFERNYISVDRKEYSEKHF